MTDTIVSVDKVSKSFGDLRAVCGLSFSVEAGTCFSFLGPNGAGKTTMMKMVYGKCVRDRDCGGRLEVFGYDPRHDELEIKYNSGVVPQSNNLDEELNVLQNLMIYSRFYGLAASEARSRIEYLLDFLELPEKSGCKIRELSGGMKRRLVIARALINNPKLLILDEPTTGLDPQVRHLIWDKLIQLKKHGTTILLTTHYMEEAFRLSDTVLIMHKGEKIMEGSPQGLLDGNIEKYVLEVGTEESMSKVKGNDVLGRVRVNNTNEITRLFSDDVDDLKMLADVLKPGEYHLREANLEDVFLKATGGTLSGQQ
ncbi:MAG: ABC transporter ATP-binding protein [Planctomycetes bacterium]|nr:ABC transporter ATP-binding protein [Planctomycetota bacterium]